MEATMEEAIEENRLNPLNDYLFMKYMGEKGDEEQLAAFLSVVLQKTSRRGIRSIKIVENKAMSAEIIGDKSSILDVRATLDDGTNVNIEVQLRNLHNMDRRSLFYWGREYTRGINAGQDYGELPNVIAINIINFNLIQVDAVHTSFHLWEDHHKDCLLTDALEVHFIDMVKFRELREKDIVNNRLHRWLAFFDKTTSNQVLKEVLNMDIAIQKAQQKITFVSRDKEALRAYQMREMALSDFTSGVNFAREEGRKEGREEERKEIILNLSQSGLPAVEIARLAGLSNKDVERILQPPAN
jgi:predicted transposase/invertase (TIGR01784 family)